MVLRQNARLSVPSLRLALRLDAALYRDHPEFAAGEYEVDVIAPGRLLVRADVRNDASAVEEADPVLGAFLAFMDHQMAANPGLFTAFDPAQLALVASLVEGVDADGQTEFPVDLRLK